VARFAPLVGTVLNPLAGHRRRPGTGSHAWAGRGAGLDGRWVAVADYVLGSRVPAIDRYVLPVVAAVVAIPVTPVLMELRRSRCTSK
jgi:membrane-associated protein